MLRFSSTISTTVLRQEHDILHNAGFQVQINRVRSILFRFLIGQFPHEDPAAIAERSIQQDIGRILIRVYGHQRNLLGSKVIPYANGFLCDLDEIVRRKSLTILRFLNIFPL